MGNRWYSRPFCGQKGLVDITAKFTLSAAGVVTATDGIMVACARAGVGVYTLTFDDPFPALQCANIQLHQTTPQIFIPPQLTVGYNPTTGKLWTATLTLLNATAAAQEVNNISELHCSFRFRNFSGTR